MDQGGKPNFNKRRARNTPGHSHFLTFSTYHRQPYLADEHICIAFAESIAKAAKMHRLAILAYVFMPDHVHLLIHPLDEEYSMPLIMKAIKQGISNKAKRQGWITTDLWERGGGYDRNIYSEKARSEAISYIHRNPMTAGLVEDFFDYRWSSARWYTLGEAGDIECVYYASLVEV